MNFNILTLEQNYNIKKISYLDKIVKQTDFNLYSDETKPAYLTIEKKIKDFVVDFKEAAVRPFLTMYLKTEEDIKKIMYSFLKIHDIKFRLEWSGNRISFIYLPFLPFFGTTVLEEQFIMDFNNFINSLIKYNKPVDLLYDMKNKFYKRTYKFKNKYNVNKNYIENINYIVDKNQYNMKERICLYSTFDVLLNTLGLIRFFKPNCPNMSALKYTYINNTLDYINDTFYFYECFFNTKDIDLWISKDAPFVLRIDPTNVYFHQNVIFKFICNFVHNINEYKAKKKEYEFCYNFWLEKFNKYQIDERMT